MKEFSSKKGMASWFMKLWLKLRLQKPLPLSAIDLAENDAEVAFIILTRDGKQILAIKDSCLTKEILPDFRKEGLI